MDPFSKYLTKNNTLNSNIIEKASKDAYIISLFAEYNWCKTIKELRFCFIQKISLQPKCENCFKPLIYRNPKVGYGIACSRSCISKCKSVKRIKNQKKSEVYALKFSEHKQKYPWIKSLQEGLNCKRNNISQAPKCYCGNKITYIKGQGYPQRCSYRCANIEDAKIRSQKGLQTKQQKGMITKISSGETISGLCNKYDKNHVQALKIYRMFGEQALLDYIHKTPEKKTILEKFVEKNLGLTFHNQSPKGYYDKKVFIPDFKLNETTFLDIDGLYWHSEKHLEKNYHVVKRKWYESQNIRCIQIREDELLYKTEIIKSLIEEQTYKIRASKCTIQKVSYKNTHHFLQENHLQGVGAPSMAYGLYYDNVLVCCLSIRKNTKSKWEISRFCTKIGYKIHGGFSRLLKFAIKCNNISEIYSWCDLRYSQGKLYETNGFVPVKETLGWSWTDGQFTYNRLTYHKDADGYAAGLYKIYDAGQRLYMKQFK